MLLPAVGLFFVVSVVFAPYVPSRRVPPFRGALAHATAEPVVALEAPAPTAATTTTTTTTSATNGTPPVATAPAAAPVVPAAVSSGCADALAYLASHQAPGFIDTCADGSALGHYGFTCADVAGMCPGVRIIRIACPAPFVYMNEAHNSRVVVGLDHGVDPYGQGTPSEQAFCNAHR